jgi:Raf kinase inhibitor-like YbhB/YbcL family protein
MAFVGLACSSGDGKGTTGAGGRAGTAGATGTAGSTGTAGAGGGAGATGTAGATGAAGGAGAAGASGTGGAGAAGTAGAAGAAGTTGTAGATGAAGAGAAGATGTGGAAPFALTSTAFRSGEVIPVTFKCTGDNVSPPLMWTPGPAGTKSYAVTLIHDAPDMSVHWVLWDIPLATSSLPMGVEKVANPTTPAGSKQMKPNVDGSTWFGYQGVCPQAGTQKYLYAVYALDVAALPAVTTASSGGAAMAAVKSHQLAVATLGGTQMK